MQASAIVVADAPGGQGPTYAVTGLPERSWRLEIGLMAASVRCWRAGGPEYDLEHPYDEAVAAYDSDREQWPDSERQYKESQQFQPSPRTRAVAAWGSLEKLRHSCPPRNRRYHDKVIMGSSACTFVVSASCQLGATSARS